MAGRKLPAYHRTCDICGREFIAHHPKKKRCSPACTAEANRMQSSKDRADARERKKRRSIDGVSVSMREKVLEALKLGVSYGGLQTLKAREAAERAWAKAKKKAAKAGGKKKG